MKSLKEAMGPMLGRLAQDTGSAAALAPVWAEIIGEVIARHTRPTKLVQGTLTIACDTRAWRDALEPERAATLKKIQSRLGASPVRAILFESP